MSFYVCNPVELVSLPYSYLLRVDTSTSLIGQEGFEYIVVYKELKELLAGTEEGKMCTVKYTVY